jgi:hypothetical protein
MRHKRAAGRHIDLHGLHSCFGKAEVLDLTGDPPYLEWRRAAFQSAMTGGG